jgi:2-hydroxy-3-keto-5-methylthiopentenyl-1-phosphate phosphatase
MIERVIAVVFDFDETLGPDTISFFLKKQGIDVDKFWQGVKELISEEWDPPFAYMHQMLELSKTGKLDISKKALAKTGQELPLFPGLPEALKEIKDYIKTNKELKETKISLEFYIISGGLEELIRSTKVASFMDGIFGSNFAYDKKSGKPIGIKSAISFTEKTRFVHGIRKGISVMDLRKNPYRINDAILRDMERVPFTQMIYLGDGPSDIPCLSAITKNGGTGIGVSAPFGTFKKGYELARGKRITVGPYTGNYKKDSDMRKVLEETILRIGLEINMERKKNVISSPSL